MSTRSRRPRKSKTNKRKRDSDDEEDLGIERPFKRSFPSTREIIKNKMNDGKKSRIVDVLAFGDNSEGILGISVDEKDESRLPLLISQLENTNVIDFCCGGAGFNFVIETSKIETSRRVWSWGYNQQGVLGRDLEEGQEHIPAPIPFLDGKFIIQITAGECHAAALTADGYVYTWGLYRSEAGPMGFKPDRKGENFQTEPELMEELTDKRIVQICSTKSRTLALTETGEVYEWGFIRMKNKIPERHLLSRLLPTIVIIPNNEKIIALFGTCGEHVFAQSATKSIYAWGNNVNYQLGVDDRIKNSKKNNTETNPRKRKVKKITQHTRPALAKKIMELDLKIKKKFVEG